MRDICTLLAKSASFFVNNTSRIGHDAPPRRPPPPDQRDAFLLQYEAGLSLAEIAALTGAGIETVKSRLRYAVGKLRHALGPLHEEE